MLVLFMRLLAVLSSVPSPLTKRLPLVRRRYRQALAVFRDCAPGDIDSLIVQQLRDLAVAQGLLIVFGRDHFLDHGAYGRSRTFAAVCRADVARKEIFELVHSARRMH